MHTLTLPRLGQTMTSGTLVEWRVAEGQTYEEGDELYVVETDKSTLEVEATLPGTLARQVAPAGEELPVGALLGVVADPGEQLHPDEVETAVREAAGGPATQDETADAVTEQDAGAAAATPPPRRAGRPRATPRAKRLAAELAVDLAAVAGTGADGAITEDDVRAAAAGEAATEQAGTEPRVRERRRLSGVAQAVADQMTRSWQVPQFSQDVEIDPAPLRRRREALRADGVTVSFTDLLIDGLVAAVRAVPEANATFEDGEVVLYDSMHVGVAVATDRGLLVPVLADCDRDDLPARSARLAELVEQARAGTLGPDAFTGGTVTLSNLGMAGVETGVPLVNAPQVCIVFAGSVIEKPVIADGEIVVGERMRLVAAYDHRVIDGAKGAEFVTALRAALADPDT